MKKLSLLRARFISLSAVSMILMFSCVFDSPKADDFPDETSGLPLSERLSIDDARVFFEDNGFEIGLFGLDTRTDEIPGPEILWSEALYSEFFGCEVIEVQIVDRAAGTYHSNDPVISDIGTGEIPPINTVLHLIAGLDSSDSIAYRIVHIVPAEGFLESRGISLGTFLKTFRIWDTADNYSGSVHIHGMDGKYVKGFKIMEGCITHGLAPIDDEHLDGCPSAEECSCEEDSDDIVVIMFVVPPGGSGGFPPPGPDGIPHKDDDLTPVTVESTYIHNIFEFDWSDYDYVDPFGGSGGGSSGGGGGGSGSDNNNNDKCTTCNKNPCECCKECSQHPCICCTVCKKKICECKEPEDPCENLKLKLNDPLFMDILEVLKSKTGQEFTKEHGYKFKLGPNGEYIFSNIIEGSGINQTIRFDIEAEGGWTGCIHAHFPGCGNVFSFGDLPFIAGVSGYTPNLRSFMYGLATGNGYYFLNITDMVAYSQWYNRLFPPGQDPDMDEIDVWEGMFNEVYGINRSDYGFHEEDEKMLAKFLLFNNVGLSLMKYNPVHNRFEYLKYFIGFDSLYKELCPDN